MRAAVSAPASALMIPSQAFPDAVYVEIAGFVLAVLLVGSEFMAARRLRTA